MTRPLQHDVLYVMPNGQFKSSASYSSRKDFKHCPRLFALTRRDGWKSKRLGASMEYGNCIEAAVMQHVKTGKGGVEKFVERWNEAKKLPNFDKWVYTPTEVDWDTLLLDGIDHLKLFIMELEWLPIPQNTQFQVPLSKHIFPNTSYGKLKNTAYLDMLCDVDARHPKLAPMDPEDLAKLKTRTLCIDCKTASKPIDSRLVCLDPQLIEYAWMKQTLDTAFLTFIKRGRGMKGSSRVTLLAQTRLFAPGTELTVFELQGDFAYVGTRETYEEYDKACKGLRGKALDVASQQFLTTRQLAVEFLSISQLTKQQMQFITARISQEDVNDMGRLIGRTTVEMVVAHEEDFYPKDPSVRFPNEKCVFCDMRFICTNDTVGRDMNLTRTGEEWLEQEIEE